MIKSNPQTRPSHCLTPVSFSETLTEGENIGLLEWWQWDHLGNQTKERWDHQRFPGEFRVEDLPLPPSPSAQPPSFRLHLCPWDECMSPNGSPCSFSCPFSHLPKQQPRWLSKEQTWSPSPCGMFVEGLGEQIISEAYCMSDTGLSAVRNLPIASDKSPPQISFSQEIELMDLWRVAFRYSWVQDLEQYPQELASFLLPSLDSTCVCVGSLP